MTLVEILFRFFIYGILGWCGEILWTAITRRIRGDVDNWVLMGETTLWAFLMYGSAAFLFEPVHNLLRNQYFLVRGFIYLVGFWTIEYLGGWLVWKIAGKKPWDYSKSPGGSLSGLIRFNFAPVWLGIGLLAEPLHDFLVFLTPIILNLHP